HLFYEYQNERLLLERTEEGYWTDKADMLHLTTEELVQVVQETPERLSNNVVTRPLMQESLFPTLAFVGGNGEIAYWSTLKGDRKSTRLNSSHVSISYAVFCLK